MQPLFNLFIAPMFNKFTPLEKGPLFVVEGSHMFKDIKDEFENFDVDRNNVNCCEC